MKETYSNIIIALKGSIIANVIDIILPFIFQVILFPFEKRKFNKMLNADDIIDSESKAKLNSEITKALLIPYYKYAAIKKITKMSNIVE